MASRRLLCGVLVAVVACVAWAEDNKNELDDDGPESSCDHEASNAVLFPFVFLAIGAATLYLTSRYAPDVPYTVLMLCWGFLIVSDSEQKKNSTRVDRPSESLRVS